MMQTNAGTAVTVRNGLQGGIIPNFQFFIHAVVWLGFGEWCGSPRQQSQRGGKIGQKIDILNNKICSALLNKCYIHT
jgi:hypothetical protein